MNISIIILFLFLPLIKIYGENNSSKNEAENSPVTKSYRHELTPAQDYYEAALKGELARPDENKKALLSSMKLISAKESGMNKGGIYKDIQGNIWIVKQTEDSINEYLGSKLMNLLIGPWSPEVMLFVDAPNYTASKLLPNFVTKNDAKSINKPIVGEANLEAAMDLMALEDRHEANMGYIELNDRLEAARVDFDSSFFFPYNKNNYMLALDDGAKKNIYSIPDEMILYVLGDAFNSLWSAGIVLDYKYYKDLGSILIKRKMFMRPRAELIKDIKENKINIDISNFLEYAVKNGDIEIIKLFYSKNLDLDLKLFEDAVNSGHIEMVRWMLGKGADINAQNSQVLIDAAFNGHTEIVKLFLEKGADVNAQNSKALINAAWQNHPEIVKLLLEQGANVKNSNILLNAVHGGNIEIVKLVLEHGADPNAEDSKAFLYAVELGQTEMVKLFLEYGVNPNDKNLEKAFQLAISKGYTEIVNMLLEYSRQNPEVLMYGLN